MAAFDLFQPAPNKDREKEDVGEAPALFEPPPSLFDPPPEEAPEAQDARQPSQHRPTPEGEAISLEEREAFRRWTDGQIFRNPDTEFRVQYESLPEREQARIRNNWLQGYRQQARNPQPVAPEPVPSVRPQKPSPLPGLPEGFELASRIEDFKPGDKFFETGQLDRGPLIVQRVSPSSQALVAEGGIRYYTDEIASHKGGGYFRKPGKPVAEDDDDDDAQKDYAPAGGGYGPVRRLSDLESHDIIEIESKKEPGKKRYFLVRKIGNSPKFTRIKSRFLSSYPVGIPKEDLKQRGARKIKVEDLPDRYQHHFRQPVLAINEERVGKPSQVRHQTLKSDGKIYRVLESDDSYILVQERDEDSKRWVGKPKKVTKGDLQREEWVVTVLLRELRPRKPPGMKIKRFDQLREGRVLKVFHEKKPTWVRIEKVEDDKVTFQPLKVSGRPDGPPEEITEKDFKQWAHFRRVDKVPKRLPKEKIEGDFSEPGEGQLTRNKQKHRYEDVHFEFYEREASLRKRLEKFLGGRLPEGTDVVHYIADLAGVGGIARSVDRVQIRPKGDSGFSVVASGPRLQHMARAIYFDADGNPSHISNSYFRVKGRKQRGLATKMLATQVAAAREVGFKNIHVSAAGNPYDRTYQGYYVWPALGYDGPFSEHAFHNMPQHIQDRIKEVHPEAPKDLRFVHVMAAGDEARKWWKAHGFSGSLKFPLDEGSLSVEALTKYLRKKAAAKGEGVDEFLQRAAKKSFVFAGENEDRVEEAPELTSEEESFLNEAWDEVAELIEKRRGKHEEILLQKKQATRTLIRAALEDPYFGRILLGKVKDG